ncbi:MAG: ice-binding family protein [Gammaproteobacteria bacterium]|nr:ice-binding family protein [Gammaproteobacteria bacterium]MDP2346390.1 ice-binding family protein [Gammaproteobacteria bacterium]
MTSFINTLRQKAAFALLPLLLLVLHSGSVQAAASPSYSATASGTTSRLSLSITINVADADLGKSGNYYVGFNHNGSWYFNTPAGWVPFYNGAVPIYASGSLISGTAPLLNNENMSAFIGAQLYIGYGLTESDMVNNSKYALVYTVTGETAIVGPAPVLLGTSGNFAILAKTAVSTVPTSAITGDVGVSPAATSFLTGFSLTAVGTTSATSPQVTGSLYGADMTPPTNSNLTTAVLDMQTAYTDAAGRPTPDFLNLGTGNIGGRTLPGGLYKWGSSVTIPGNVTISGGANDVWIFQVSGDLSMSANQRINLTGGAQAKNIFWQVAGEVLIGAGAHFEGNILSQTSITLQTGASLHGRALAQTMVALDKATVTKPAP